MGRRAADSRWEGGLEVLVRDGARFEEEGGVLALSGERDGLVARPVVVVVCRPFAEKALGKTECAGRPSSRGRALHGWRV